MAKIFVILIGGPGLFLDCDPMHDKTWVNYLALRNPSHSYRTGWLGTGG